jgi:hypothetical protein
MSPLQNFALFTTLSSLVVSLGLPNAFPDPNAQIGFLPSMVEERSLIHLEQLHVAKNYGLTTVYLV